MLVRCIKVIQMEVEGSCSYPAKFTEGNTYKMCFENQVDGHDGSWVNDDNGAPHYMPPISDGRDPEDGWDTGDYFQEVA